MMAKRGSKTKQALDAFPPEPEEHFRLFMYAAVHRLVDFLYTALPEDLADEFVQKRFPFLGSYVAEIGHILPSKTDLAGSSGWWAQAIELWEKEAEGKLPLGNLVRNGYSRDQATMLLLVGLVDEDARFGALFSELQAPLKARRPSVGLMRHLLSATGAGDGWTELNALLDGGFTEVVDRDAPRAEWLLKIPSDVWDVIRDGNLHETAAGMRIHAADDFSRPDHMMFSPEFRKQLNQGASAIASGSIDLITVRGGQGSERREVIGALAREAGMELIEWDPKSGNERWSEAGPLSTLTRSIPVASFDLAPGESASLDRPSGYTGVVGCILSDGSIQSDRIKRQFTVEIPHLTAEERRDRWQQVFRGFKMKDLDDITSSFMLGGRYIQKVGVAARDRATVENRKSITLADVRLASRDLNRQLLETLADRLEATGSWEDVIVGEAARKKLLELEQRCRLRETIPDHVGPAFRGNLGPGVRTLFSGPSGTGKTLAARVLASTLGKDLYRVDLAAVINKYIGETEKNLHKVLSQAEELDVILLLDEGDALLGTRTEVRSAHDRYANLETNYLLQRLEHYRGIVLVTTNLGRNIDRAFQRRMDVTVDFRIPQSEQRLSIWHLHLPENHEVRPDALRKIAIRYPLSGGQIRNAALNAAMQAMKESKPLEDVHLAEAVASEFRKAGAARQPRMRIRTDPDTGVENFIKRFRT